MRTIRVTLHGQRFGRFEGAVVETPVEDHADDAEARHRLRADLGRLIDAGRILYTEPHQKLETKDCFDAGGRPYMGVVRWREGRMVIERVPLVT